MSKAYLTVYNFVCHFGREPLADRWDDIVVPAFRSRYYRKWGDNLYKFLQVREFKFTHETSSGKILTSQAIWGRIANDTVMKARQVIRNNNFVPSKRKMETAPSAVFILLRSGHRLILVNEMPYAPKHGAFEHAIAYALKRTRLKIIEEMDAAAFTAQMSPEEREDVMRRNRASLGVPTVDVRPLSDKRTFDSKLNQFDSVNKLIISLLPTNNDLDSDEFMEALRSGKQQINAITRTLIDVNNEDGLNKTQITRQVQPLAGMGNHSIELSGTSTKGGTLKMTNVDFKYREKVESLVRDPDRAQVMTEEFVRELIRNGIIRMKSED